MSYDFCEQQTARRQLRRENGLCCECNAKALEGKARCARHLAENNAASKKYWRYNRKEKKR